MTYDNYLIRADQFNVVSLNDHTSGILSDQQSNDSKIASVHRQKTEVIQRVQGKFSVTIVKPAKQYSNNPRFQFDALEQDDHGPTDLIIRKRIKKLSS